MLTFSILLLLFTAVNGFSDEHCCCGCQHPCPVSIPGRCGASPTTSCFQKDQFNSSELLSPCDLIIKLHDLTSEEHTGQPVPIGKDRKKPNSVTVTDSSYDSREKMFPSVLARLFSFPKFAFASFSKGELVKNETKTVNGTLIRETVRKIPGGTETIRISIKNETDPEKAKQQWRDTMSKIRQGIGRMDNGFATMQHGLVDSFDSLFKGVVDGVFNILKAR